jgi:hypothetical protein
MMTRRQAIEVSIGAEDSARLFWIAQLRTEPGRACADFADVPGRPTFFSRWVPLWGPSSGGAALRGAGHACGPTAARDDRPRFGKRALLADEQDQDGARVGLTCALSLVFASFWRPSLVGDRLSALQDLRAPP